MDYPQYFKSKGGKLFYCIKSPYLYLQVDLDNKYPHAEAPLTFPETHNQEEDVAANPVFERCDKVDFDRAYADCLMLMHSRFMKNLSQVEREELDLLNELHQDIADARADEIYRL
jgi:hypothetical protein